MYENLIFSGGGVRCLAYIGVLKYFEEQDLKYKFNTIVGTSGGALFALIYILDYTYLEIKHLATNLDLNSLQDISSENLFKFFCKYGIDSGKNFEHFIELLLEKKTGKKSITFKEFYDKKYSEEVAKLCKFPSVSFSMAMVLANLPKFVNEKAKKEYEQLYNIKV